jgi:hypothetical protein
LSVQGGRSIKKLIRVALILSLALFPLLLGIDRAHASGSISGTVYENSQLTFTAPPGEIFTSVDFANYGLPIDYTENPECSLDVTSYISSIFLGQNTGTVNATNDMAGDPCSGVGKRLSVILSYSPDTNNLSPEPTPEPSPEPSAEPEVLSVGSPTGLGVVDGATAVTLNWNAPTDGTRQPERYAIFFRVPPGNGWAVSTGNVGDANALDTTITIDKSLFDGLMPSGNTWVFKIRSDNDTLGLYSGWSNEVSIKIGMTQEESDAAKAEADAEAARIQAEAAALLAAQQEAERLASEAELARLQAIADEAARIEAERLAAEAEAARIESEIQAAIAAEQARQTEIARQAAIEAENARIAAQQAYEAEQARIAADAARAKAEAEAKAAEEARIKAEAEAKAAAEAAAKAEADRISAEEAAKKAEEEERIAAEVAAAKAKAEAEKAEADRLEAEAKAKAEEEARAKAELEAKIKAEEEAKKLAEEKAAEEAKAKAESDRLKAEADAKKAEEERLAKIAEDAEKGIELSKEEVAVVVTALVENLKAGESISAAQVQESGVSFADLPPSTPIELRTDENGNELIITAEVAANVELVQDPGALIEAVFTDPGAALAAFGSIGADMTEEEREEATDMVIATVVATGAALNAVGLATGGSAPSAPSSGSSSGTNSGGSRRNEKW